MSPDEKHQSPEPKLPVALPAALLNDPLNAQVSSVFGSFSGTDTSPLSPPPQSPEPRRPVGPRQLSRLRSSLSDRDREVLELVASHRYLTTRQVEAFCFHDHASPVSGARSARRVLRRLAGHGLLQPLERRVGGIRAGSASYVWQLGTVGHRLLRDDGNLKRTHEPSPRFLAHSLAVADAHLELLATERRGAIKSVLVELEPDCWRSFTGAGGERRLLQPDMFLITKWPRYIDHWFIEIDLGTESLKTVLHKCAQYEDYRASGNEQSAAGVFPLVIWQLPDKQRLYKIATAVSQSPRLFSGLFRFVLPDGLAPLVIGGAA